VGGDCSVTKVTLQEPFLTPQAAFLFLKPFSIGGDQNFFCPKLKTFYSPTVWVVIAALPK